MQKDATQPTRLINEQKPDELEISYYLSFEEFKADHFQAEFTDWKLSQSVAAFLLATYSDKVHLK